MCIRAVSTYSFVFDSVLDQYKSHKIFDKAVDNYAHALEFVPDQHKT